LAIEDEAPEVDSYCRQLEAYLCRKNEGHLIRIVGPAFEQVCGWATRGVPIKVAERGIDRYFERYYAKGPRRRPVQIQFCEADVFDVFDEWRRAVGVPMREGGDDAAHEDVDPSTRRHGSLPAHLDRVIARLTMVRGGEDRSLDDTVDRLVRELDAARAGAKGLRGEARAGFLERLSTMDGELIDAARGQSSAGMLQQLEAEAEVELAPFRDRMAREVYERSRRAAVDRLIRERRRLPVITFD
jgi:hypothetical protein